MNGKFVLHTHTLANGHAYSTLAEMIQAAASKGLELYGCTDHAPAMPGTLGSFYFQNFKVIPRQNKASRYPNHYGRRAEYSGSHRKSGFA